MCNYCGTQKYRKIYENHVGPILEDEMGRTYEIHHIDGDHHNNNPNNLKSVSMQEHYNIHHSRGDIAACLRIAVKMKKSKEEIKEIASMAHKQRLEAGTHIFQTKEFRSNLSEWSKDTANKRVLEGTHPWQDSKKQRDRQLKRVATGFYQTDKWRKACSERGKRTIENGSNPFSGGKNPSKIQFTCPHCNKIGNGLTNAKRWHFDNCKSKI